MGTVKRSLRDFEEITTQDTRLVEQLHGRGFLLRWIPDSTGEEMYVEPAENTLVSAPVNHDTMPRMDSLDQVNFEVYPLKPETTANGRTCVVGRGPACDVIIDDSSVSRRHAELEFDDSGSLVVTDHDSTNGTLVARRPVFEDSQKVEFGKSVQFGQVKLTFMPVQQFTDFVRLVTGDF